MHVLPCAPARRSLGPIIIQLNVSECGLRAAKMLRKQARTARVFAAHSSSHEDNKLPPKPWNFSAAHDEDDESTVD
jgi:hypothetical protein